MTRVLPQHRKTHTTIEERLDDLSNTYLNIRNILIVRENKSRKQEVNNADVLQLIIDEVNKFEKRDALGLGLGFKIDPIEQTHQS